MQQLLKPLNLEPVLYRSHHHEKPGHLNEEQLPTDATGKKPTRSNEDQVQSNKEISCFFKFKLEMLEKHFLAISIEME